MDKFAPSKQVALRFARILGLAFGVVLGLSIGTLLLVGLKAVAQEQSLKDVENVLDRLEKKLLEQEEDSLSFSDDQAVPKSAEGAQKSPSKDSKEAEVPTVQMSKQTIIADPRKNENLQDIAKVITDLEARVDELSSAVQKTRQHIIETATANNLIEIQAQLGSTKAAGVRSMRVKLDGFEIYSLDEASGIWATGRAMPLYAGPMQPGNHKLELEAKIVLREQKSLPLNNDVYKFVNKTVDINVPGGAVRKRWSLVVDPPSDPKAEATVEAKESNIE